MIRLAGVGLTYESTDGTEVEALDGIDLAVAANEFVVIVGPSGCGKSTLLKLIVGLLRPTRGSVHYRGAPVTDTIQEVGMVYQSPVLLPWRSVLSNVLLPIEILRRDVPAYTVEAHKLLAMAGLAAFARKTPRELSGGMQQRAALCRALITDPPLLLMDEPFAALDALTRDEMGQELLRLWEERRKTVVFVTHSIPEAVLLGDRVIVMSPRPGRIVREIPIGLPRPRTTQKHLGLAFVEHVEAIRDLIYSFRRERDGVAA
jgi:NitT/TauT family transport system ATP-binding protein